MAGTFLPLVPGLKVVYSIFKTLSENGNPKELFLESIEFLNNLEHDNLNISTESETIFGIQFHLYFELLRTTMKRINTQYPSRFLANSTTCLFTILSKNLNKISSSTFHIVLRRLYIFARDYNPPLTDPIQNLKNFEIEESIQRKLLQSYVTFVVALAIDRSPVDWCSRLLFEIKSGIEYSDFQIRKDAYEMKGLLRSDQAPILDLLDRFGQLILSIDLDPIKLLQCLIDDIDLKDSQTASLKPGAGDLNNITFNYNRPEHPESVQLSQDGILYLITSYFAINRDSFKYLKNPLTLTQVIALTVKYVSRPHIDLKNIPVGIREAIGFWSWWIAKDLNSKQLALVPQNLIKPYLQLLLFIVLPFKRLSADGSGKIVLIDPQFRKPIYTLIAKILSLLPDKISYDFLMDWIKSNKFELSKNFSVNLLKDLLINKKSIVTSATTNIDELSQSLKNTNLNDNTNDNGTTETYIKLTDERKLELQKLIQQSIKSLSTIITNENLVGSTISINQFKNTLSWIGVLNSLSSKFDVIFIKSSISEIETIISKFQSISSKENINTFIGLLNAAVKSLKKSINAN